MKRLPVVMLLFLLLAAMIVGALLLGLYGIPAERVLRALVSPFYPPAAETLTDTEVALVLRIRLPRILAAALIGGSLALTGAAFQGVFRNPLVDANLLGVMSGAGFGAALGLLLNLGSGLVQGLAFAFGLLAVTLAYLGSRLYNSAPLVMLTLMGVLIGSFFGSLISLLKYVADPLNTLPAITFWLLGGLSGVTWNSLPMLASVTVLGSLVLVGLRWRLNVLSLGDAEAATLGMNPHRLKLTLIVCATFMTAAAVAVGGIIGWIGLVIPHAARVIVGPDHQRLIPASMALGAIFLLAIDTMARTMLVTEVPLGVLTGLVGVPILIMLLRRNASGW